MSNKNRIDTACGYSARGSTFTKRQAKKNHSDYFCHTFLHSPYYILNNKVHKSSCKILSLFMTTRKFITTFEIKKKILNANNIFKESVSFSLFAHRFSSSVGGPADMHSDMDD